MDNTRKKLIKKLGKYDLTPIEIIKSADLSKLHKHEIYVFNDGQWIAHPINSKINGNTTGFGDTAEAAAFDLCK